MDVLVVIKGLKLYLQRAGDTMIQRIIFDSWNHHRYVGILLILGWWDYSRFTVHALGCLHDSQICNCGGLDGRLESFYT